MTTASISNVLGLKRKQNGRLGETIRKRMCRDGKLVQRYTAYYEINALAKRIRRGCRTKRTQDEEEARTKETAGRSDTKDEDARTRAALGPNAKKLAKT